MSTRPSGVIRFEEWSLDPRSGELMRRNERVVLQEQPLQVLLTLLSHPGQVVTREELVDRLWPERVVDFEGGLNAVIRRLRVALHDDADSPHYIETLPRRGYRFIGQVAPARASSTSRAGRTQPLLARSDCLVVIHARQQAEVGRLHALDQETVTIGRSADSDIVLHGQSVSRRHAHIEYRGDSYYLVDEGSTNGAFVNDSLDPIQERALSAGDEIRIGDRILKYLCGPDIETQYQDLMANLRHVDALTGASDRRELLKLLSAEILRLQRHGQPLSLALIEVDDLVAITEKYGQVTSDTLLRSLAGLLRRRLRALDVLARYGPEQFAVMMPQTPLEGASRISQALRTLVENTPFAAGRRQVRVTVSIGLTCASEPVQLDELCMAVEHKLEQAKSTGRNTVVS